MMAEHNNHPDEWDEIWALFAQEGVENLDLVEDALLDMETNPNHTDRIAELFRALHTFKGMARMMGLTVTESLAHYSEDLVGLVRDQGVTLNSEMITLLLAVLDRLRAMLGYVLDNQADVEATEAEELVGQLKVMFGQYDPQTEASPTPGAAPSVELPPDRDDNPSAEIAFSEETAPAIIETEMPDPPEAKAEMMTSSPPPVADNPDELEVDFIDPATDPTYVRIFLEMALEEMTSLQTALTALKQGDELAGQTVCDVAGTLGYAAQQMGYDRLLAALDALVDASREPDTETRTVRLKETELNLFEELMVIQETGQVDDLGDEMSGPGFAWLFRQWHAERVFADLAHLHELVGSMAQLTKQFLADGSTTNNSHAIADEAAYLLQGIYHSCVFYKLEVAAHLTLALEDLCARIVQGEIIADEALLDLTQTYVAELGSAIEEVREGNTPPTTRLEALIERAETFLSLHAEGRMMQVTKDILNLIDLSAEFKEVITPENLIEISQALQAGEQFYTILADMNQDEGVATAFFEWTQTANIRLITNITVYKEERSLFDFLLATVESETTLRDTLVQIDPIGTYLHLKQCALREEVDLQMLFQEEPATSQIPQRVAHKEEVHTAVDTSILADFMGTVGKLLSTQATIHQLTERLTEIDPLVTINTLVRQAQGDWATFEEGIRQTFGTWTEDIHKLEQAETELGGTLSQLHASALSLRIRPATDILAPLQRIVEDVAQHQGKKITLALTGEDAELDQEILNVLATPIQRLVWFSAACSIETPQQRTEAGKTTTGQITVALKKQANSVRVVIQDDGKGLELDVLHQRAAELGWTDTETDPTALFNLMLQDDFGLVGGHNGTDGLDLGAIQATLQPHQGRLSLNRSTTKGMYFTLDLPLSMVVVDGMVVRVGQVQYIVPINAVHRIVQATPKDIVHSSADGGQNLLRLEESLVPIQQLTGRNTGQQHQEDLMLVVEQDEKNIALSVDELVGQQQVMIQPLQGHLTDINGVSGCALLGDGEVGMVLSIHQIGEAVKQVIVND